MPTRKGLGRGKGKGYKNIVGKDPKVHSDSARGRKQPQKLPHFIPEPFGLPRELQPTGKFQPSPMKDQELAKTIRNLDPLEERFFISHLDSGMSPEKALEVVVNMVEGDTSQLSPGLLKYAEKKGWLKGFDDAKPNQKIVSIVSKGLKGWDYNTSLDEDIQIDKITKKFTKKELLDEVREFDSEKDIRQVLNQFAVKHPESNKLDDYSHRAIASASFIVEREKTKKARKERIKLNYPKGFPYR